MEQSLERRKNNLKKKSSSLPGREFELGRRNDDELDGDGDGEPLRDCLWVAAGDRTVQLPRRIHVPIPYVTRNDSHARTVLD